MNESSYTTLELRGRRACLAAIVLVYGCGGRTTRALGDDGAQDSGFDGGGADRADAWTQCSAPDGVRVCGGSSCPTGDPSCGCYDPDAGVVEPCLSSPGLTATPCAVGCASSEVCVNLEPSNPQDDACQPHTLGELYERNGQGSRVWFSDFSSYSEDVIVPPQTCPTNASVTFCGGPCGDCGSEMTCTGQSPIHPIGWCAQLPFATCRNGGAACSYSGNSCFTYNVQAAAQPIADAFSYCVATATCDALAVSLPGGGTCAH